MNLIYWKSDIGNFGDDLNPWLWERIFGDFSKYTNDIDFVGIGSQLDTPFENERRKIIFGAGIRDFLFNPKLDKLDIRFVRGPYSAKVFNNCRYITDAAYCLALLEKKEYKKKYNVSYMPYFRHVPFFDWTFFEKWSGIKVILPTNPVEQIIQEINESRNLLTSAMHGAIVADIYRVPWMRVKYSEFLGESLLTSELKWADWLQSMDLTKTETHTLGFTLNYKSNSKLNDIVKTKILINKFKHSHFILTDQSVFDSKICQLAEQVEFIKEKYKVVKE